MVGTVASVPISFSVRVCVSPVPVLFYTEPTLTWISCHFREIFATDYGEDCHLENFQCNQWWKFRQYASLPWMVNKSPGWSNGHSISYFPITLVCQWAILFWLMLYFCNYTGIRLNISVTIWREMERLNNIQVNIFTLLGKGIVTANTNGELKLRIWVILLEKIIWLFMVIIHGVHLALTLTTWMTAMTVDIHPTENFITVT